MPLNDFLSPKIHPFSLLLLGNSGCAAGAPVVPMAVADVEVFVLWILPKCGVKLVALVELVGNQVALAPGRGQARGQSVLSGSGSRAALHFRLNPPLLDNVRKKDALFLDGFPYYCLSPSFC